LNIVAQPAGPTDEALIHELVHALRIASGRCRPVAVPVKYNLRFDNVDELLAVVIANIYRSENHRCNLRAEHRGHRPLQPPFTDPGAFYLAYEQELDALWGRMMFLFVHVAQVICPFNPIRACVQKRLGLRLDSDFSDYESLLVREQWW
jgi:hypothetical protein